MKKYKCEHPHSPPHWYSDCISACVKTLTQNPNVPHFFNFPQHKAEKGWGNLRKWLLKNERSRLVLLHVESKHNPFNYMKYNNPGVPYMLICSTKKGGDHAIVCRNDVVVNDPGGLVEPKKYEPHSAGVWMIGLVFKK